jgi:hypothetical protein
LKFELFNEGEGNGVAPGFSVYNLSWNGWNGTLRSKGILLNEKNE